MRRTNTYRLGLSKKKLAEFYKQFDKSELLKKVAVIRAVFHENMEHKPVFEIEKAYRMILYCREKNLI